MVDKNLISAIPMFNELSENVIGLIAEKAELKKFEAGEHIFKEGDNANSIHFLVQGTIALQVQIMTRPDHVTVSYIGKSNDCFGWSGLVSPNYYTASAICEDTTEVLEIQGADLLSILEQHPAAGFKVMHRMANLVSDRLRNSRQALIKTL